MFADSLEKRTLLGLSTVVAVAGLAGCSTGADRSSESTMSSVLEAPFTAPSTESWPFPVPSTPTTPTVPGSLPAGESADRSSADSVALIAARIWFSWDTTRDTSPYDAALRATPLMGPACQKRMVASAPQGSPGNDWTELARVHAKATVTTALGSEERPADRGDTASRIVTVTQKFTADKPVPVRHVAAMVLLTRTNGKWEIGSPSTGTCGLVTR